MNENPQTATFYKHGSSRRFDALREVNKERNLKNYFTTREANLVKDQS